MTNNRNSAIITLSKERKVYKMRYTTFNKEKGYYEIVKSGSRFASTISYGIKKEDSTVVIPVGNYTENEIRMAEWELCNSIDSKFKIVKRVASIPNITIVKEEN